MMLRILATAFTIAATLVASAMTYAAFQHNPQGETFDPRSGAVHYGYVAELFLSWLLASFIVVAVCGAGVYLLGQIVRIWK